jgi:hypothetical protein
MSLFFHVVVCFLLTVFQSAFPFAGWDFGVAYDLSVPYICFAAVDRPPEDGMWAVPCLGAPMESVGGGPFGLYIIVYLWLYIGIRGLKRVFHLSHFLVLPLVVTGCVLVENIAFVLVSWGFNEHMPNVGVFINLLARQAGWSLFTGALFFMLFRWLYRWWIVWATDRFSKPETQTQG